MQASMTLRAQPSRRSSRRGGVPEDRVWPRISAGPEPVNRRSRLADTPTVEQIPIDRRDVPTPFRMRTVAPGA